MATPPGPGWYVDAGDQSSENYWDGYRWIGRRQAQMRTQRRQRRRNRIALWVGILIFSSATIFGIVAFATDGFRDTQSYNEGYEYGSSDYAFQLETSLPSNYQACRDSGLVLAKIANPNLVRSDFLAGCEHALEDRGIPQP